MGYISVLFTYLLTYLLTYLSRQNTRGLSLCLVKPHRTHEVADLQTIYLIYNKQRQNMSSTKSSPFIDIQIHIYARKRAQAFIIAAVLYNPATWYAGLQSIIQLSWRDFFLSRLREIVSSAKRRDLQLPVVYSLLFHRNSMLDVLELASVED